MRKLTTNLWNIRQKSRRLSQAEMRIDSRRAKNRDFVTGYARSRHAPPFLIPIFNSTNIMPISLAYSFGYIEKV